MLTSRRRRWIVTIPSFDQWLATIENHWKTIGCNGCWTNYHRKAIGANAIGNGLWSYRINSQRGNFWPFHCAQDFTTVVVYSPACEGHVGRAEVYQGKMTVEPSCSNCKVLKCSEDCSINARNWHTWCNPMENLSMHNTTHATCATELSQHNSTLQLDARMWKLFM